MRFINFLHILFNARLLMKVIVNLRMKHKTYSKLLINYDYLSLCTSIWKKRIMYLQLLDENIKTFTLKTLIYIGSFNFLQKVMFGGRFKELYFTTARITAYRESQFTTSSGGWLENVRHYVGWLVLKLYRQAQQSVFFFLGRVFGAYFH